MQRTEILCVTPPPRHPHQVVRWKPHREACDCGQRIADSGAIPAEPEAGAQGREDRGCRSLQELHGASYYIVTLLCVRCWVRLVLVPACCV